MKTVSFIDWVSYVVENEVIETRDEFERLFERLELGNRDVKRCKPRNSYKIAYQNEHGVLIMCSPCRPDMGINILLTGTVLANFDWFHVLGNLLSMPGHVARLDLTVDARDSGIDPFQAYTFAMAGQAQTKAQSVSLVQSKTGSTCYIGSRASERFLRIYDKAGEQKLADQDWKRIELECSGDRAHWISEFIMQNGKKAIPGLIREFIDFPTYQTWIDAFAEVTPIVSQSTKRVSDTVFWLMETIAPTLAKQIVLEPTLEFDFQERLQACIRELTINDKVIKSSV